MYLPSVASLGSSSRPEATRSLTSSSEALSTYSSSSSSMPPSDAWSEHQLIAMTYSNAADGFFRRSLRMSLSCQKLLLSLA